MIIARIEIAADSDDLCLEEPYYAVLEIDGRQFEITDIRQVTQKENAQ